MDSNCSLYASYPVNTLSSTLKHPELYSPHYVLWNSRAVCGAVLSEVFVALYAVTRHKLLLAMAHNLSIGIRLKKDSAGEKVLKKKCKEVYENAQKSATICASQESWCLLYVCLLPAFKQTVVYKEGRQILQNLCLVKSSKSSRRIYFHVKFPETYCGHLG